MSEVPRLRMFAGPNGSGKTTIKSVIRSELLGVYVNPDEIEKEIAQRGFLDLKNYRVETTAAEVLFFFNASVLLNKAGLLDEAAGLRFNDDKLSFFSVLVNSYFASVAADFIRHKLLERGYSAMTVRFFMLQCHYASTLDFSNAALQAAEKGLEKMRAAVGTLDKLGAGAGAGAGASAEITALEQASYDAMNDDLNTPIMIAHLFDGVRMINSANDGKLALSREDIARLNGLFNAMLFDVLGMRKEEEARGDDGALEGVMRLIIEMRSEAKATRNFALSDRIRDQLAAVGISIKDSKEGSTWDRK